MPLKSQRAVFTMALFLSLAFLVFVQSRNVPGVEPVVGAQAACTQVSTAAVTHGFTTTPDLPVGDHIAQGID